MTQNSELKGGSFTLSVFHLRDNNLYVAQKILLEKINQAASFFDGAPLVIDISGLDTAPDFVHLKTIVEQAGMLIVGISGCKSQSIRNLARKANLAVLTPASQTRLKEPLLTPTKIISTPIRSGQQIYARNSDLVILNHVSAGAEVIADGSIHIYGVLRGRAIAGACGQNNAHIFCQNLQSELLSIAGTYWLSETIPQQFIERSVKISLLDETLNIKLLTL